MSYVRAPRATLSALSALLLTACGSGAGPSPATSQAADTLAPLTDSAFAALVERVSEPGGYFDTDNLISNEAGYLKVLDALDRLGVHGGAFVGVGPDQSFSYIARIRPAVAFMVDIRRDNMLQHLLLRALLERSPTRIAFLCALHGRVPPADPGAWRSRSIPEIMAYVDGAPRDTAGEEALHAEVAEAVAAYGVPLSADDLSTIRRFHQAFVDAGPDLRFHSYGRAPRPYYPTYRQLVLETDRDGKPASYLADPEDYAFVRRLEMAGRVIPVVGDLAGSHAVRELGTVMREMGVELSAFYTSNVEFYLWQDGAFPAWVDNLASLPAAPEAVVIRSYFPNFGRAHPSAVPGYYATQTLQPVATLRAGGYASYWDLVTRDAVPLG